MIHGRWKPAILFRLFEKATIRTGALRRDIPGISQKMLTQHLRALEADGLVERIAVSDKPLHVDYALSRAGRALVPVLTAARAFSQQYPDAT